ncbi:hypothetical protein QYE76_018327 [Lolium multiflorum]|uniref:CCHC-type domain-containing protein n=1 Tax=Lolium multiflorum TaxID=4521 RepID=A0AAD8Q4V7_LOLMU|nr:hypothetical protein QYE76_018327 [Lolium multiflorum]
MEQPSTNPPSNPAEPAKKPNTTACPNLPFAKNIEDELVLIPFDAHGRQDRGVLLFFAVAFLPRRRDEVALAPYKAPRRTLARDFSSSRSNSSRTKPSSPATITAGDRDLPSHRGHHRHQALFLLNPREESSQTSAASPWSSSLRRSEVPIPANPTGLAAMIIMLFSFHHIYTPIIETNMDSEDEPTEDDMEYDEGDSSASTADMEDHVELDTDNGSASIGDMTDIEHLYTDHDSPSMDNMVDHHSELDDNIDDMMEHRTEHYLDYDYDTMMEHRTEHYLDYDYDTMMEHRTEHYLDYDIDTMVEPSFDTTLHKTGAYKFPTLANGTTYDGCGPSRRRHHESAHAHDHLHRARPLEQQERPRHDRHRHSPPSSRRHHKQSAKLHEPSSRHVEDRHRHSSPQIVMLRIVIDTRHLKIVVDHHHLMITIDIRHHMIIADTSHLMFAIDQHLPRIFDDTPQDMVMIQEDENLDMKRPRLQRKMVASAHKEEPPIMVPSPPTATTTMAPTRSSSPKMKTMESTLQDEGRSTQLYANMTMICPPRPRSSQCFRCTQDGHHLWECPNLHCDVCTSNKHMTWECNTPQAHKLYFAQLDAQFANKTLQDTIIFKEWCKEMDKMTTMKPTLQDGVEKVEHGMIPSTKVANGVENGEHGILPSPTEAHGVEMVEHGKFPSTTEAHGDEQVEPTPTCLIDELVPNPCEHESHLAHLSESDGELSDFHPICEFECFHLEDMSDTQSELREVDDRSTEDIAFANTLTSPSFVSSYVAIGSMEDEFPLMEKMYMVHEDDDITPCLLEDQTCRPHGSYHFHNTL